MYFNAVSIIGVCWSLGACWSIANPSVGLAQTFVDASDLLGPQNGEVGIGASIVDVNSDGLIDIYRRNTLYLQKPDGSFENAFDEMGYEPQSSGGFGAIHTTVNAHEQVQQPIVVVVGVECRSD